MADANRGDRPLSPFMIGPYYRPQLNSIMSILHRITGVGMTLAACMIVWWLLGAAAGPDYFATADAVVTSWVGLLILFVSLWALMYHLLNGARHLWWDLGYGLEIEQIQLSGQIVAVASGVLTLAIWFASM